MTRMKHFLWLVMMALALNFSFNALAMAYEGKLTRVKILGPSPIDENSCHQYTALARYKDGRHISWYNVTEQADWYDNRDYAYFDGPGYLCADEVNRNKRVRIEAYYTDGRTKRGRKTVRIRDTD